MQRRNAAQNYYYFGLLLAGLLLATISRRLEPLLAVVPLLVALVVGRLPRQAPRLQVACTVAPQRLFEGDRLTVHLTVTAQTRLPPTELWHLLPAAAQAIPPRSRFLFTLEAGETRTFTHEVTFARRGRYTLGHLYCRVHPGPDLRPFLAEYHCEHVCTVYPRFPSLPRPLPPRRTHASFGHYVSRTAGEGLEFAGIRAYQAGDRLRRVHWRASSRRQALYVNDYYCERNADVVIVLDTLADAGVHDRTLDAAVRTAAALAVHYLHHKDRVGLITYGGICTWVSPGLGQRQVHRILEALVEARPHFSYLTKDVTLIPPRVLPPQALVLVVTALLDPRIETALHDLLSRAFQLVLVVVPPLHALQALRRPQHREAAIRLWRLETELHLHPFRRLGIPVLLLDPQAPEHLPFLLWRGAPWPR